MKLVLDECLPKKLIHIFNQHEVWTVPQMGLAGTTDQELLDKLDAKNIDVFITIDGNIEYQQRFSNRFFGTIIIRSVTNRLEGILLLKDDLLEAVNEISPSQIRHIPAKKS